MKYFYAILTGIYIVVGMELVVLLSLLIQKEFMGG
jgi:hypothetical protein